MVSKSTYEVEEAESRPRRQQSHGTDDAAASVAVRARRLPVRRASTSASAAALAHASASARPRTSSAAAGTAAAAQLLSPGGPTLPADGTDFLRPSSVSDTCDCVGSTANLHAFFHRPGSLVPSAPAHAPARVANSAMMPPASVFAFVVLNKKTTGSREYFQPRQEKYQERSRARFYTRGLVKHFARRLGVSRRLFSYAKFITVFFLPNRYKYHSCCCVR